MSLLKLKDKINKRLEELDAKHLQSAHFIIKELVNQQKYSAIKNNKSINEAKIARGIYQLDNGEGTEFSLFLNEMQAKYGRKKQAKAYNYFPSS